MAGSDREEPAPAGPVLRERDVLVRRESPADSPAVAALLEDRDVRRWLPDLALSTEPGAAGPLGVPGVRPAGPAHRLVVEVRGGFAGLVLLTEDGEGGGWLTCAAPPAARGRGTTARAVRLALTWAFVELGLQAVHWSVEAGAWPARRLAWACGSGVDGTVGSLLPVRGDRRDAWVGTWRWDSSLQRADRWLSPVELVGGGVRLGPHLVGDVQRVAQACSAASTQAWLPSLPSPYTVLDAASWIAGREEEQARGAGVFWAVRADSADSAEDDDDDGGGAVDGPLIAEVGLFTLGDGVRSGEVGYWCHPDARGRGVTTAAVRLVVRHALAPTATGGLGLERVVVRVASRNAASRRVAEKAGFREVGVDRAAERLRDGTLDDFVRYDLLAGEEQGPRRPGG
ncbi:GNAT family N-acetyltransferase [Quadrisphaera sp. RL12-1S]|uniref:GNAT family N-acetyltransferase n=1 Tax=Quadrisphaera sp. RL12-1S TaxID=2763011 RepID=UPI001645AD77|nr:GNAT family N-acetyltransferase [Quadrisphaera sp. RL12-1S]